MKKLGVKTDLVDLGLGEPEIRKIIEKVKFTGMNDETHPNLYDVPFWTKEDYIEVMKEAAGLIDLKP